MKISAEWMVFNEYLNQFDHVGSKPFCVKYRLACMTATNDEREWDGSVCQFNEMRFEWYANHKIWLL